MKGLTQNTTHICAFPPLHQWEPSLAPHLSKMSRLCPTQVLLPQGSGCKQRCCCPGGLLPLRAHTQLGQKDLGLGTHPGGKQDSDSAQSPPGPWCRERFPSRLRPGFHFPFFLPLFLT